MLKNFSITLGAFFLIVLLMGIIMPAEYEVKRSITINADVATIHPYVEDLEQWPLWTHWNSDDNTATIMPGEKSKGEGASQKWSGKSGVGVIKITKSSSEYGIDYLLDMNSESMNSHSSITYDAKGPTTDVTWTTAGKFTLPVIGPYISMAMDGTAGPLLETGLKKLKNLVETGKTSSTTNESTKTEQHN